MGTIDKRGEQVRRGNQKHKWSINTWKYSQHLAIREMYFLSVPYGFMFLCWMLNYLISLQYILVCMRWWMVPFCFSNCKPTFSAPLLTKLHSSLISSLFMICRLSHMWLSLRTVCSLHRTPFLLYATITFILIIMDFWYLSPSHMNGGKSSRLHPQNMFQIWQPFLTLHCSKFIKLKRL